VRAWRGHRDKRELLGFDEGQEGPKLPPLFSSFKPCASGERLSEVSGLERVKLTGLLFNEESEVLFSSALGGAGAIATSVIASPAFLEPSCSVRPAVACVEPRDTESSRNIYRVAKASRVTV